MRGLMLLARRTALEEGAGLLALLAEHIALCALYAD